MVPAKYLNVCLFNKTMILQKFFTILHQTYQSDKKKILLLFIFTFFWNFFLIQGLPFFMHGHDDFSMGWTAKNTSWTRLFYGLFFERIIIDKDMYFQLGGRSTYFIFYKIFMFFDGMRYPEFNYFFRIIIFSFNTCLLFILLRHFKIRPLFAMGGSLIYTTAVSTYEVVNFIGDLTLYSHFFTLLCFYLFFVKYLQQPKTNPLFLSITIFLIGLLAIKSKQIAIIIPPVLFLYSLFIKQNIAGTYKRRIPLFSILLFYYLPSPFSSSEQRTLSELLLNFKTYYIYNPWTRIDAGEQLPAIFSPISSYLTVPGSLLGIYKFLLGWLILIMTLFFIILIYKNYKAKNTFKERHIFFFILLWHASEISIMSAYFTPTVFEAIRYIGIAVPSFIAITFFFLQQGSTYLENKKPSITTYISIFFIITLSLTILSNMYLSAIPIRGGLLSRHVLIHDSIYEVYKDHFNKTNIDDTIFFRIFHWMDDRTEEEKLSQITFTDLATEFGQWYNQKDPTQPQQKLKENNYIYILTFKSEIPFTNKILLKKLSACPPETSLYCYFKNIIKGQNIFFNVFKVFKEEK